MRSSTTSISTKYYSDLEDAAKVAICVLENQLMPLHPPIITAPPEAKRHVSGRVAEFAATHSDSF